MGDGWFEVPGGAVGEGVFPSDGEVSWYGSGGDGGTDFAESALSVFLGAEPGDVEVVDGAGRGVVEGGEGAGDVGEDGAGGGEVVDHYGGCFGAFVHDAAGAFVKVDVTFDVGDGDAEFAEFGVGECVPDGEFSFESLCAVGGAGGFDCPDCAFGVDDFGGVASWHGGGCWAYSNRAEAGDGCRGESC